jgi:hypothetical protein
MPVKISFFYAIYRRLQASAGGMSIFGQEHFDVDNSDDLGGGFSLKETTGPYGLFGSLSPAAPNFGIGLQPGWKPLNPNSNVPLENPLYAMLAKSLDPDGTVPDSVTVAGHVWPVMPPPFQGSISGHVEWLDFNAGPLKLIDAFGQWIKDGKIDDSPKNAPLTYAALRAFSACRSASRAIRRNSRRCGQATSPWSMLRATARSSAGSRSGCVSRGEAHTGWRAQRCSWE